MDEPLYEYIRGQGWIPTITSDLDYRTDKTKPGVWRWQIWLVGITYHGYTYPYKGWCDNFHRTYATLELVKRRMEESLNTRTYIGLTKLGMKARIINVDADGGWDVVPYRT